MGGAEGGVLRFIDANCCSNDGIDAESGGGMRGGGGSGGGAEAGCERRFCVSHCAAIFSRSEVRDATYALTFRRSAAPSSERSL